MDNLTQQLQDIFGDAGCLQRLINNYHPRQAQIEMAQAVSEAMLTQQTLVVEAGTGTGKTFAYLAPALLFGGKVIISTGTKNLQDQLFYKDISVVRAALNLSATLSLLKGRANYLCHFHLARTLEQGYLESKEESTHLQRIVRFSKMTQTGDKSELAEVPESATIWQRVTSTKDNCLGAECPHYQDCFVMKARKEAQQADIVVVNHHLFFADIVLKDRESAELLPTANTIIFDEAHQLPDIATLFFSQTISTGQLLDWCRDTLRDGLAHARDGADWTKLTTELDMAARLLRSYFHVETGRFALSHIPHFSSFKALFSPLKEKISALLLVLSSLSSRDNSLLLNHTRGLALLNQLTQWETLTSEQSTDSDNVLWVEVYQHSVQLHCTPLTIAPLFTKQRKEVACSWIFTSATLAVKKDFSYFLTQMGLLEEKAVSWPSPFNYSKQGLLYIPQHLPHPHTLAYTDALIEAIIPVLTASKGRAFLLCTTLRAVKDYADKLREKIVKENLPFDLLVQGEFGKNSLLKQFRDNPHTLLIGSHSFWEGVDVVGEGLSVVIIDKIPFAPPEDPVLSAKLAAFKRQGENGFMTYQLPEAIIHLKQGAGRLIRHETDRGILMLCDPRLLNKPYGKFIWQSMPPFTRTRECHTVQAFFLSDHSKIPLDYFV